ncbi:hypothetical protein I4U23_010936 [Adineta vaga]|nr:hypothetical protein I4U23_010936 [Adineta vaga]
MLSIVILKLWVIGQIWALSLNRPKFHPNAVWNPSAMTFANISTVGTNPYDIFINTNNTIYVANRADSRVVIWTEGNALPTRNISNNLSNPYSLFVTTEDEIYVDSDSLTGRIDKWTLNATNGIPILYTCSKCSDIFVDDNDNLYCSMNNQHQVVQKSLNTVSNAFTIIADPSYNQPKFCANASWDPNAITFADNSTVGTNPYGMFISTNNTIYVPDRTNNQIQIWFNGSANPTRTLSGGLYSPYSIFVTINGDIFVDNGKINDRVDKWSATRNVSVPVMYVNGRCTDLFVDITNTLYCSMNSYHYVVKIWLNDSSNTTTVVAGTGTNTTMTSTISLVNTVSSIIRSTIKTTTTTQLNTTTIYSSQTAISYNRPKLNPYATWNPNAITFANSVTIGTNPYGIFISTNNTIYVSDRTNNQIQIWSNGSANPTRTLSGDLNNPCSIFGTMNGDIFVDNGLIVLSPSYNQPKFCANASWDPNAITFADNSTVGTNPYGMFISTNNTIYVPDRTNNQIQIWFNGSANPTRTLSGGLYSPYSIFVTINGDIFVDNGKINDRVDKWSATRNVSVPVMYVNGRCTDLFVDITNTLYCSMNSYHYVVKIWLNDSSNTTTVVAGTGTNQTISTTEQISTEQITTITTLSTNHSCSAPIITLIPGAPAQLSPIQFRRSQDFTIVSLIELNCNISLSMITQWTIKNCSTTCSNQIQSNTLIKTTFSELYIPGRSLPYGLYEMKSTVTMTQIPSLFSTAVVYVKITSSGITANLIQYGTSMITRGNQQDLQLNPGSYSVNPDEDTFNASIWKYKYYCRIYGSSMFPNLYGSLLTIDDMRNDSLNPSCLSNRTGWKFDNSFNSSMTILSNSLQSNRIYQFMVQMENLRNSSLQATGYVLVKVEDTRPNMILIGCVIWTMCRPNLEFQLVNPTTQVALFSICTGNCSTIYNITWNVYFSLKNSSSNFTQWNLFNQMITYQNIWFFGTNTTNFTALNQLFLSNPQIQFWRFEVVYTFLNETSSSSLNFIINQPPSNGTCVINPLNGTTTNLFTISCSDWFDEDEIKDYTLYAWINNPIEKMIVAYSAISIFQLYLPIGNNQTLTLHLILHVRDQLDCITELNLSSVTVYPDTIAVANLINDIQNSSKRSNGNSIIQLLASGNQNLLGQLLTSVSQQFNQMNEENLNEAVTNGIPSAMIAVSPLDAQSYQQRTPILINQSALDEYNKELNSRATVRDYLIQFITYLPITTSNSIKLQASSLAQLTKATNELTRTTLSIASDRCYQLALTLASIRTRTAYEDIQFASDNLLQCATNLLIAVNGPLQQRTTILDLDSSRATVFPNDYDTDLESAWSNLNLFADGDDFSWTTIQKNRNIYDQKQLANQINTQMNKIISLLTSTLNLHLNIGQNYTIATSQVWMTLETRSSQSLSNSFIKQIGNGQVQLPSNFQMYLNNNEKISIRSMMEPLASFGNATLSSNTNLSRSISFSILDHNQNEISIQPVGNKSIELIIPRDPNLIIPSMILQNVTSMNFKPHNFIFHYHYLNLTTSLPISVHWEIQPLNTTVAYLFIYRFDQIPHLNSSINQIDGWTLLCPSALTNESIYTYYIDNQQTIGHQAVIYGIRELDVTEINQRCSNLSISDPPIINEPYNFTSNYQLRVYTSGCYYLNENNQWKADGLLVGSLTNHYQTQCYSTHLTTFAGGFIILPSPIDWSYVFANADFMKNKTIYLTVICVCVIYVTLIVYARFYDKKDLEKLGVTVLPDNYKEDQYFYQIIVFTGQRKNAGTKSNVHFVIHGNDNDTQIRTFADPHRQILQRGGIDAFLVGVRKPLGLLNCIRIWHDNSGQGSSASWFLKYLIVRDLRTMEKYHFICQRWFAVEKDDGKIERILPVAGELEKHQFSYVLTKRTYHSVSDGHLWFSIFSRPPSTQFTRVQRCTCCFVLFFISMFLNIMYYDLSNEAKSTKSNSLSFGSLSITPQQIIIGVIVELFALIPSLLLVQLFRRLRPRQKQEPPIRQALYKVKSLPQDSLDKKNEMIKSSFMFPWWCIFIAYGLCIIFVGLSILFIIARGIEFGDGKSQQWLASILSSFFSSVLLTQPLKIISLAIIFACFCRQSNDDKEANELLDDNAISLDADEEYLHITKKQSLFTYRSPIRANRLNETQVTHLRHQRLKELQMWSIIREMLLYLCFLSLLYVIIYSNRDSNAFLQVNHLRKYFLNLRQNDLDYTKVSTINQYWNWLEDSFVDNLRAQNWYNGEPPRNLSGFIDDKSHRLIGWATMRQLRVKPKTCSTRNPISSICQDDYSCLNEDKYSYAPEWKNETSNIYNSFIRQAFVYQSADILDTYMYVGDHGSYSGGGYVYEFRGRLSDLRSNLSQLHQLSWIDNQTRAVIIQLTLYNPNVQLFTAVTFLAEFLSSSGLFTSARFEPISFSVFTSIYQVTCTIIYMILIMYFMWIEIRLLYELKWKYFQRFWSYIEVGIIVCSWTSVGIYIWRYKECQRILKLFKETNGFVYINLQLASYVNDILTYLLSFSCFFGTIQLIKLCRFNQRLYLFIHTLQYSAKELVSFSVMFAFVFISFVCLFHLLFISELPECSSLLRTAQMLFEMTLMKFDAYQLSDAAAFLGPFCFSLFIIFVVFICMSMFLSIVADNFRRARENMTNERSSMLSLIFETFQRWTGLKKVTEEEIQEERDARLREEYYDPIRRFPDKIDQLLVALNQIYENQKNRKTSTIIQQQKSN